MDNFSNICWHCQKNGSWPALGGVTALFIENRLPTNVHKAHRVLCNPSDSVKLLGGCIGPEALVGRSMSDGSAGGSQGFCVC